jgi:hypothetical protein
MEIYQVAPSVRNSNCQPTGTAAELARSAMGGQAVRGVETAGADGMIRPMIAMWHAEYRVPGRKLIAP